MNPVLVAYDNFHPDPERLREAVLKSEFKDEIGPDGANYTGISKYEDTSLFELLAAAVHAPIIPRLPVWRLTLAGEKAHTFVHADRICGGYAAVLYLNTPEQCRRHFSGTAFWKHSGTGFEAMPSEAEITANGHDPVAFNAWMEGEWRRRDVWEMTSFARMMFNRIVIYPTAQFHSRYPFEAFGDDKHTGRLIFAAFFDLASAADIQHLPATPQPRNRPEAPSCLKPAS